MKPFQFLRPLAGAAFAALIATGVQAQTFPERELTIVVPYAPGSTDQLARALTGELEEILGQPVVVETRPGGGGSIGANFVANSAEPDGHTMLFGVSSVQTVAPHQRELPYGYDDLKPVARITIGPNIIGARAGAPFDSLESLIAYAKENPGEVTYGSAGTGGATHLAGEALAQAAGIELTHIPFEGVTPAIAAAVGGNVDLVFGYASAIMPQVEGGNLVAIAQLSEERVSGLPDLTTLREGGVDLALPPNIGVWVPAETPDETVAILTDALEKAVQSEEFTTLTENTLTEIDFAGPEEFAEILQEENAFFEQLLTSLGMAK